MSYQQSLFSSSESRSAKESGMSEAASSRKEILEMARSFAIQLARLQGSVCIDDVMRRLAASGIDPSALGNASGSVFKADCWECIGFVQSARVSNHSRMIRKWRLK